MSDPFDEMVDDVFAELGKPALYKAGGTGAGIAVRLRLQNPDLLIQVSGLDVIGATTVVRVRISEIAQVSKGDVFVIDGKEHRVVGTPKRDDGRRLWIAGAAE